MTKSERFEIGEEVAVWVEQETIHIKAIAKPSDPVELTAMAALQLAKALTRLATRTSSSCRCASLSDPAVIHMGKESDAVMSFIEERGKRGDPYWWLWYGECACCGQKWLVASEERQNDIYCLKKMDAATADRIVSKNKWPSDFDAYDVLLRLGKKAGIEVKFADPYNESSLEWTIKDLAKGRPGIKTSEIADLLNLDSVTAVNLSRRVVDNEKVAITFD